MYIICNSEINEQENSRKTIKMIHKQKSWDLVVTTFP